MPFSPKGIEQSLVLPPRWPLIQNTGTLYLDNHFNTQVVKILCTPVSGQGVTIWTLTRKTHFPNEYFDQTRSISRLRYSKTLILAKEKL